MEGTSSGGGGEIPYVQTPVSFDSGSWRAENGNRRDGRNDGRLPKLEFPIFDGSGPREWKSKYRRYIELHQIPEEKKLGIIQLYFKGRAFIWFQGYVKTQRVCT